MFCNNCDGKTLGFCGVAKKKKRRGIRFLFVQISSKQITSSLLFLVRGQGHLAILKIIVALKKERQQQQKQMRKGDAPKIGFTTTDTTTHTCWLTSFIGRQQHLGPGVQAVA